MGGDADGFDCESVGGFVVGVGEDVDVEGVFSGAQVWGYVDGQVAAVVEFAPGFEEVAIELEG